MTYRALFVTKISHLGISA